MKGHTLIILALTFVLGASAQQCGRQANNAVCPNGLCCSQYGFCGNTDDYCKIDCQSQCHGGGVGSIITESTYHQMLKDSNDARCPSKGFYKYSAFITAAESFHAFGNTGDAETRKRELAAFFGQTSHETTGGWPKAPDGPYAWGYCYIRETNEAEYCTPSQQWPCAPGQQYYGRGPIQLTNNDNYGLAGDAIGSNLLSDPDLVATDPVISFKTAIWFWMTAQGNKPSSHDVITGQWQPSGTDKEAGRAPGYGVITNIINGEFECGHGPDPRVADRIGFYKRYCDILGVGYGNNLDCYNQGFF